MEAKPYKAEDIYDNLASVGINTSVKVAMHVKQEGQPYEFARYFLTVCFQAKK